MTTTAPPTRPPRPPGPTAKPAAVVFGIILAIALAGWIADAVTSSHSTSTTTTPAGPATAVPGTGGLVPEPSNGVLASMVTTAGPPADVLSALVFPRGSVAVPGSTQDHALGLYDSTVSVQVPAAQQAVITFWRAELSAGRWHVISSGAHDTGGYQFIAQHPSSDGYEWELGLTVAPTSFSSSVPGVSAAPGGVTETAVRLFEISGDS